MSGYGHENVIKVARVEIIKKEYRKIAIPIAFSGLVIVITKLLLDLEFPEEFNPIKTIIHMIIIVTPLLLVSMKPTWIKIGEVTYQKTVLTSKWDYDEYKRGEGRKW